MVGIEWVVHVSLLQATEISFDARGFLYELSNHHVLALDADGQIRQRYTAYLTPSNSLVSQWYRRMVAKAGGIALYPTRPLEDTTQADLASLGLSDEHPFVSTARQTLDQLLAGDTTSFPPQAQNYLRERLGVQVESDWQAATQRGQPLSEALARWLIGQGEGESVEFKTSLTSQLRRSAIETLAAFAVKNGGTVFFGVKDDGTICGVQATDKTVRDRADEIRANTDPPLTPEYLRLQLFQFNEGTVLAVSVDPFLRECRAYGRVCRRVGSQTLRE
jgi:hypothetical protein